MADKTMELEVISPDRSFYKGTVTMVEFNTTEGYMGIYPDHISVAVIVSPGVLVIHEPSATKKAALHSGFAKITGSKVTIFAEIVEWPEEIDFKRAEEANIRAKRRLGSREAELDLQRAEIALKKSIARISLKD